MRSFFRLAAVAAFTVLTAFAGPVLAADASVGPLQLSNLWTRATPAGAPTGAGYLTITNTGDAPDRLVGAATPLAAGGELHEMKVEDGRMSMRPVAEGVAIPAGGTVTLAPGGYHLMFTGLREPFAEGGELPVTLTFEKAGTVEVTLHIMPVGSPGPQAGAGQDAMPAMEGMHH